MLKDVLKIEYCVLKAVSFSECDVVIYKNNFSILKLLDICSAVGMNVTTRKVRYNAI